jgi:DNA modification methylase
VWNFKRPSKSEEHPMMKPVELVQKAVTNGCRKDGVVVDLFGGSGTTLIASEKIGRKCFMMEMDSHYCDVIVKRYLIFCETNGIRVQAKRNGKPFKQEEA